ncbi:hypothetical protein CJD36_011890 [Flavipsychrobacter stenotrophus]|uniref:Ig-like domain-containing protein n=2 Tax=Flavipsychrobacter stenotrophus TaxID=2077091 RepID=A0A2S7SVV5_9BACT|nr:hypothetical protein CJD36_011890 [Flavipsychrobacter stenotrophus]
MINKRFFLSIILCVLAINQSMAQMLGDCVFLKGKYVEIGVAPNGGYGSTLPAPGTYHPNLGPGTTFNFWDPGAGTASISANFLGFVADYGRDGWAVGVPGYFGDFYLPGTPQEGWAINVNGSESEAYIPSYNSFGLPSTGFTGTLAGTNLAYVNSGGISKGIWKGNQGALGIRQTTILDTTKLFFTVNVVLTNTGATPLNNIYYLRTVDPDNEQTQSGDFTTSNTITYQLPSPGNRVLVSAVGIGAFATNAYLGLGTKDCRAKSVIYDFGLDPGGVSLPSIYNETSTFHYTQGFNLVSDVGIGLVYNIGTIAPGDSTSLTYAYILNAAYIDSALDATQPAFQVNSLSFNSGDTINLCTYNFDTVLISMGSGSFYHWHWSPSTYLTDTNGVANVISADSINTTMTYTITGVNVSGACDTVTYFLTFVHDTFNITLNNHDTGICIGQSIQASVVGPPLLSYSWSPTTGVSNPIIMNPILTPNVTTTYTVTASSSSGCPPVSKHFTINVAQLPLVTMDSAVVKTCVGVPVPLHATVSPAGVPYTYSWSPGTNLSSTGVANPVVTPAAAGDVTYTVTVSPSALSGCIGRETVRVHTIGDFTINTPDANICLGRSVTLNVTGSVEMGYTWTPATGVVTSTSMAPVITPAAWGSYTYTATGSYANCPDYVHVFRIKVDTLGIAQNYRDTICLGQSVAVDVTVPGSNATTNYYHYQWVPGAPEVANDTMPNTVVTPATTGVHTYIVTASPTAANCSVNDLVTIKVLPNAITISPIDTAICQGQIVQAIGTGDALFTYQWLPTTGIAGPNSLNTTLAPDTSVTYIIRASYPGCPDMFATLHLDVQPNPTVYVGGNRPLCQFDTLHIHAAVAPAWYSGYLYSWAPSADLDNSTSANVVFDGTINTTLVVTVTTPAGCKAKDSALITIQPGNFASIIPDASFCPHDSLIVTASSTVAATYAWHPAMYVSDSTSGAPVIKPIADQTYTIVATSAAGCKDTVYWTATVYPGAMISVPESVTLYAGETFHIEPITNCSSFTWFPITGLDYPYIANPTASPDVSTLYIVTATTEHGCKAIDSIYVIRDEGAILELPNAFTPGGSTNNKFYAIDKGMAHLNYFRVYNRWGNVVFETKDINEGWDGSWKGEPQPFGVYVYNIQGVSLNGKIINKTGNVTLLR